MARCPECHARLVIPTEVTLWDHIFCEECGVELEVVDVTPLELEVVLDIEDEEELEILDEDEDDEMLDWDDDDATDDDDDNDDNW